MLSNYRETNFLKPSKFLFVRNYNSSKNSIIVLTLCILILLHSRTIAFTNLPRSTEEIGISEIHYDAKKTTESYKHVNETTTDLYHNANNTINNFYHHSLNIINNFYHLSHNTTYDLYHHSRNETNDLYHNAYNTTTDIYSHEYNDSDWYRVKKSDLSNSKKSNASMSYSALAMTHGEPVAGNGEVVHGGGHHSEEGEEGEHHEERFQVAKFDFQYVKTPFIVGIWILYAVCAKLFFHWEKRLSKIFPESCLLIMLGVLFGVFLFLAGEKMYEVNTTIFFLVLLPPIILDAGYYMPARSFFDQLGTILLYAIMGTLLNNLLLGFSLWGVYEAGGFQNLATPLLLLHALVLGSLLAAVDPVAVLAVFESVHVNEMLYIIVFGESLLNDGISVVLYHLFEGYSEIGIDNILGIDIIAGIASFFVIVFGATGIGMLLGLLGGFMSRFTSHVRKMEPLIVLVIGYLSFIIAEMFHLSGIISCTFCGITMRKYVEANFSEKSQNTIHIVLKMFAQASETIVFMYIGMSAVSDVHHWDTAFCILTLIFCLIFRTICVIGQTFFANLIRVTKLTKIDQLVMAYGGLRGAIAFALVLLLDPHGFPHRKMFITTTVLVIYFTNIAMGSTIEPLVRFLKVKREVAHKPTMGDKIMKRFTDHIMGGLEDITGQSGHHQLRERFSRWNNEVLKPLIVGKSNPQKRGWQIVSVYNKLNQKAAKHHLRRFESTNSLLYRDMSYLDLNRSQSNINLNKSLWWESTLNLDKHNRADRKSSSMSSGHYNNANTIFEEVAGPVLEIKPIGDGSYLNPRDHTQLEHQASSYDGPSFTVLENNRMPKKSVSFVDLKNFNELDTLDLDSADFIMPPWKDEHKQPNNLLQTDKNISNYSRSKKDSYFAITSPSAEYPLPSSDLNYCIDTVSASLERADERESVAHDHNKHRREQYYQGISQNRISRLAAPPAYKQNLSLASITDENDESMAIIAELVSRTELENVRNRTSVPHRNKVIAKDGIDNFALITNDDEPHESNRVDDNDADNDNMNDNNINANNFFKEKFIRTSKSDYVERDVSHEVDYSYLSYNVNDSRPVFDDGDDNYINNDIEQKNLDDHKIKNGNSLNNRNCQMRSSIQMRVNGEEASDLREVIIDPAKLLQQQK